MKTGTKLLIAGGVIALFGRAVVVNGDPTGNNIIDRGLSAAFQNVLTERCKFEGESSHTRAVCDGLINRAGNTSFYKYSNNLVGTNYTHNQDLSFHDVLEVSRALKLSPRGLRPHSYTDDELRGFYYYLFKSGQDGGPFIKMPDHLTLQDLALIANQSLERKCASLTTAPVPNIKCQL